MWIVTIRLPLAQDPDRANNTLPDRAIFTLCNRANNTLS